MSLPQPLNMTHYDKPVFHNGTYQTRFIVPANRNVSAKSIKLLQIKSNPNKASYYPALVGVLSLVKRVQFRISQKEVDSYYAQARQPLVMAQLENEQQRGVNKVLFGSGNNVIYDQATQLLTLDRQEVDSVTTQIPLYLLSDFFNVVGVINDPLEIIITWESNAKKMFCPVDSTDPATSWNIEAPYLSYETINYPVEAPKQFVFRRFIQDEWVIPAYAVGEVSAFQQTDFRSNAFLDKTIGKLILVNSPSQVYSLTPSADVQSMFNVFGWYMSVPQIQETFGLALNGQQMITFKNVNNDAVKLSMVADSFAGVNLVTNAHVHTNKSALVELAGASLNGFASYGCVELNQRCNKDITFTYRRQSPSNLATFPALCGQLNVLAVGECLVAYLGEGNCKYV